MPAHLAQLDKPHLEDKLFVQIATQDVQQARPQMEPKYAQIVWLIMGMPMVLAHSAQLAKLQLESKLRALPAPTKDALPVHQRVAPKFA